MGARGRKTAADLTVVDGGRIHELKRPEPPDYLTDEQRAEWIALVEAVPADHFRRESHACLEALCRHIVAMRRLGQLIEQQEEAPEFDLVEYERLLRCQERESRAIASHSTKLRLTQSATDDRRKKRPLPSKKPWEE